MTEMPVKMFSELTQEQETHFRQWARDHLDPAVKPGNYDMYHYIIRDEWNKMHATYLDTNKYVAISNLRGALLQVMNDKELAMELNTAIANASWDNNRGSGRDQVENIRSGITDLHQKYGARTNAPLRR